MVPNLDFKVTIFVNVKYLKNDFFLNRAIADWQEVNWITWCRALFS